jgi:putative transposase
LYPRIIAGCADEGYRGTFKNTFEEFHNIRIDISKQIKPIFEVLPKRWRIERTFSWFGGYRRLSKDFEYLSLSEENIIYISYAHLLLSRL